jgi:hypothetical protein
VPIATFIRFSPKKSAAPAAASVSLKRAGSAIDIQAG